MPAMNRRVLLRSRPVGEPTPADFEITEAPVPRPGEGQVLNRTIYLSVDPYMRGRMNAARSYAPGVELGQVMVGGTVSEVVESRHPGFAPGDLVVGYDGWQSHAVADGAMLRTLDPAQAPISTALGVLGMPGLTAYVGLLDIGQPKAGETVVVSAASGAVGSVVGQIAKIQGCRAVGIAGPPAKCRHVVEDLGFDACVSYREPDFKAALADACPDGIDVYFENVGGHVADAVVRRLNRFARVPVCGLIAGYNATEAAAGPDQLPGFMRRVLTMSLTVRGFIQDEFVPSHHDAFLTDMAGWIRDGSVRNREDVVDGLENAPEAFRGLLVGRNFGKLLVRVGDDPTG